MQKLLLRWLGILWLLLLPGRKQQRFESLGAAATSLIAAAAAAVFVVGHGAFRSCLCWLSGGSVRDCSSSCEIE